MDAKAAVDYATAGSTAIVESNRGKKLVFMTYGTRGDVQPYIALSLHLKASGFQVLILTNRDHVEFIESFGLEVLGPRFSSEDILHTEQGMQAMREGDMGKLLPALVQTEHRWIREGGARDQYQAIKDYAPDLILAGVMDEGLGKLWAHLLEIPFITALLNHRYPTDDVPTAMNEPALHKFVWNVILKETWKQACYTYGSRFEHIREAMPEEFAKAEEMHVFRSHENFTHDLLFPFEPVLIGLSPSLSPPPNDWPREVIEAVTMTGFWVVGKQEQEARMGRKDKQFGGASLDALREFLGQGSAPVYMGWGSMTSKSSEFMTCLALRSLKRSGMRGVILSGWAGLKPELVAGENDAAELQAYAKDNVFFIDTAPHEWLFPQCAVIVHHGGVGTTAAALRSGVPTVVTPIFADQFANAFLVKKSGCGVGTKQLRKVTDKALASAITTCATDVEMQKRAASFGDKLRKEDGLGNATKVIDQFLKEQVPTGKWAKKYEELMREQERLAGKKSCC